MGAKDLMLDQLDFTELGARWVDGGLDRIETWVLRACQRGDARGVVGDVQAAAAELDEVFEHARAEELRALVAHLDRSHRELQWRHRHLPALAPGPQRQPGAGDFRRGP